MKPELWDRKALAIVCQPGEVVLRRRLNQKSTSTPRPHDPAAHNGVDLANAILRPYHVCSL
jgi:hypothetical protein